MQKNSEEVLFPEGFRLTRSGDGLQIEAIDYHSRPLMLHRGELARLGLVLAEDVAASGLELNAPRSDAGQRKNRTEAGAGNGT